MKDQKETPYNPFKNRDADEVWQELLAKAKPISKEDFAKRVQAMRAKKNDDK